MCLLSNKMLQSIVKGGPGFPGSSTIPTADVSVLKPTDAIQLCNYTFPVQWDRI